MYPCATVTWDKIHRWAAVAGQTQSTAKTDLCLNITQAKAKALPLPAQLCIISRLWRFKHGSSPGQVTDHLMLPDQARPPFCPRQASLHLRSLSLLENPQDSAEKPALMNHDRIISEEQHGHAQTDAPEQRSAVKCWSGELLGKCDCGMRRLNTKRCTTELRCYTRPLGNYRANIKGCWSFAAKTCLFSSYLYVNILKITLESKTRK